MATSRGFGQFSRRIKIIGSAITENAAGTVRKAALVADQVAVLGTPVDTGRARANWIVSIGEPGNRVEEPPIPGNGEASAAKALMQAAWVIKGFKIGDPVISIVNNVDYIVPLDEGSSAQAPDGITKQAIEAAQQVLRKGGLLKGV